MDKTRFFSDVPFVAIKGVGSQPTGDLVLKGYASTWTLDRDQEYVERDAFDGTVEEFLRTNPILLWQHDFDRPIGVVKAMGLDDNGLDVECYVPKPDDREPDWTHLAYNKIKGGIVRTFSIGGFFNRTTKGAKRAITKVDLFEVSVVSVPSNPDSIFAAAVKSLEGSARPELTTAHTQQMAQLLGMVPVTDPEIAMMTRDEKEARYDFLSDIYRKTGKRPPALDAWQNVVNEKGKPVLARLDRVLSLKAMVDGTTFLTSENGDAEDEDREKVEHVGQVVSEVAGRVSTKRGRVLSGANERRLRKIRDEIDTILAQIKKDREDGSGDESDESDGKTVAVETLEDERLADDGVIERSLDGGETWVAVRDTKAKPTNLRAGSGDNMCSNCAHWRAPKGNSPIGFCTEFNYPTRGNQLSDGFKAKGG